MRHSDLPFFPASQVACQYSGAVFSKAVRVLSFVSHSFISSRHDVSISVFIGHRLFRECKAERVSHLLTI
jgi:hypothetical protein